jgi:hypothetical protein
MAFTVTCTPVREAAAGMVRLSSRLPALVFYLDPVNVVVQVPPFPDGPAVLGRLCRQLSREALRLAELLDSEEFGGGQGAVRDAGA